MNVPCRVLCLALLAPLVVAQNSSFEAAPSGPVTTTAGDSLDVVWGDVDGDGDSDLLVINGNGQATNHLYLNDGSGQFTSVVGDPLVQRPGNSTQASFADVDGDGDLDVFITNRTGGDNQLFINQGRQQSGTEGTFLEDTTSPMAIHGGDSTGMAWLDLEGDGDLDLFVTNSGGEDNFLYTNLGGAQNGVQGSFAPVLTGDAIIAGGHSMDVVAADFDGNGAPDLYVANTNGEDNFLYFNNGAGNLSAHFGTHPVIDGAQAQGIAAGDVDSDGDIDLVVVNFLQNNDVYLNQGGRQLGTQGDFQLWWGGAASLDQAASLDAELADWDLDGHLDLVIANCCSNDNSLFLGDGLGRFARLTNGPVVTDGGYSTAVAFSDYDRDGGLDLIIANRSTAGVNTEYLYVNRTSGAWVERMAGHPVVEIQRCFDVVAGDIDGDGDEDLFVPNKRRYLSALYVNQGGLQGGVQGSYARRHAAPFDVDDANSFAADFGDIDGDGDIDLAVANRDGEDNFLYVNQGGQQGGIQGDFTLMASDPVSGQGGSSRDVRFCDVDQDGDLDLFFANSGDEDNFLYRNLGGFQRDTQALFERDMADESARGGGKSYGADFGDMDGDGDPDLFVASRSGDDNQLFINTGDDQNVRNGGFAPSPSNPVTTSGGNSYAGVWGDMDNDGDLDLYVSNNGTNELYRNNGGAQDGQEGTFTPIANDPAVNTLASSRRAEWADLDGDGDNDLLVPNTDADNDLFRNRGDGHFALMATAIVADDEGNSRGAALADVDGDGDLDAVVANYDEPLGLYINKGPAGPPTFTPMGPGLATSRDVPAPLLSGSGKLINKTPVRLQVIDARANSLAYLFVGASELNAPLLGGTLVPTPDLLLGGLVINSNGVLVLDGMWPAMPIGASIFFQIWVNDDAAIQGYTATNGLKAIAH